MIHILEINKLTKQHIAQIRAMELQCNKFDGTSGDLWLSNEFNLYENMPRYFLLYEKQTLQGVLTIFVLASEPAEISALVLPECRRKGYFRAMLCKAIAQLKKFGIADILFVHETQSASGKQMIDKWDIAPNHSEYLLVSSKEHASSSSEKHGFLLKKADDNDFDEMLRINAAVFGKSEEDYVDILRTSMKSKEITSYIATLGGKTIGVCSVNHTDFGLFIFGFGISPSYQRKGYGRAMLNELTRRLIDTCCDDILLEVDSSNQSAYLLYTTSGFSIRTQYDYYLRKTSDISCT